jgi:hypothetical protein
MMQQFINEFEERVKEVDEYLDFLEQLDKPQVQLHFPHQGTHSEIDIKVKKILNAHVFLMLYNLVEYSIRDGMVEIYRKITSHHYPYEKLRQEIREIWINSHYRKIFKTTANWESAKRMAIQLVEDAVNHATIQLDEEALPISGNLDARQIRNICELHGILYQTRPEAKGGSKLRIVKEQRNSLAHGHLSFYEAGKHFNVTDLKTIENEVVMFIRDILTNMADYVHHRKYEV